MITRPSTRRPSIRRAPTKKSVGDDDKVVEGVSLSTLTNYRFSGYVFELHEGKGWQRRLLTFDGEVLKCLSKSALPTDTKKPKWEARLSQVDDIRVMESPKGPLIRTKQLPCFVIDHADQHHILRLSSAMEFECWMFTLGNCWTRPPTQPGSNSDYDACLDAWNRSLDETMSDSSSGAKIMPPSPPAKPRIAESPPKIKTSPIRRQPASKPVASRSSLPIPDNAAKYSDTLLPHRRNKSANPNPRIVALANEHTSRSLHRTLLPNHATRPQLKTLTPGRSSRPRSFEHSIPAPNHTKLRGWASHPSSTLLLHPKSIVHPHRQLHFASPQPLTRFSQP
ncbi:hypothetical protein DSO57_1000221 [Entomophthora muscae]|uniref:Uncharacterized protein n=1 Tax=Entomophthora muscae TaxID=34485 RepID=A0ACC2U8D2_9FUNG|nr:hypothetical protein DSO57_1000221 [Entomophthora muscae]